MKTLVIINRQHNLLSVQKTLLDRKFGKGNWILFKVPTKGLTKFQIWDISDKLSHFVVVFASPIPLLLATLITKGGKVYLFHNDKREKIEKQGKIFYNLQPEGWELIKINS